MHLTVCVCECVTRVQVVSWVRCFHPKALGANTCKEDPVIYCRYWSFNFAKTMMPFCLTFPSLSALSASCSPSWIQSIHFNWLLNFHLQNTASSCLVWAPPQHFCGRAAVRESIVGTSGEDIENTKLHSWITHWEAGWNMAHSYSVCRRLTATASQIRAKHCCWAVLFTFRTEGMLSVETDLRVLLENIL